MTLMMQHKDKTKDFIKKAKEVHGNKYDYSKSEYHNKTTKLTIICPEHGEFEQTPRHHIDRKQGCRKCSTTKIADEQSKTTNEFIKESKEIHGNKYDYSKVKYKGHKTPVTIICPEHGEFEQMPNNHLKGRGCKYCGGTSSMDKNLFIYKAKKIHGNKYDYSKSEYTTSSNKITIICPEHGEFEQTPNNHLSKNRGCPYCNNTVFDTYSFIKKAKEVHGNKYNYSKSEYKGKHNDITIHCPKHGDVTVTPHYHLVYGGCKKCKNSKSNIEIELKNFIEGSQTHRIKPNDRTILNGKELDINIPEYGLAIEFNGLYWHNELFVDKNYHLNKTRECEKQGVQLIHIFEDEWVYKPEIVKSVLLNKLNLTPNKIYGRNCEIKEITTREAREFCENNHLQGYVGGSIKLGLFHNDELVSVMTFGKLRKALNSKGNNDEYEMLRFCNKLYTNVIGGANKLFKYFIKNYEPYTIISYADKRYSEGKLYKNLGFEYIHDSRPNYFYITGYKKREHRFNYRKDKLIKGGFDSDKSEHEIMLEREIYRIYDCGNQKWVWEQI